MNTFNDVARVKDDDDYAIEVNNVSKRFKIPHEKRTTVYDNIIGTITGKSYNYEVFEALKDVSFKIKRGESFGIIGENGSGKSTLLKILAGVLVPDSGHVKVRGKVAPFLELGVGFQAELTAVENVYLYGAIMGMNRKEMDGKLDSIFEFAELDRFRDAKLKNFSSGMYARLAFATAISTDPDVLLIDEVLAVGDEAFQAKCYDKIDEYKLNGKTIVFVSHALGTVEEICERSILLTKGHVKSEGYSEKVIYDYHADLFKKEEYDLQKQHEKTIEQMKIIQEDIVQAPIINDNQVEIDEKQPSRWGSREIEITDVQFYNEKRDKTSLFKTGDKMVVGIKYFARERVEKPIFGAAIHRKDGVHVNGTNCKFYDEILDWIEGEGEIEYIIDSLPLLEDTYMLTAVIYDYKCITPYDHHEQSYSFKIIKSDVKDKGMISIPCEWRFKENGS